MGQSINKGGGVDLLGARVTLTHANHSSSYEGAYTGESCGFVVELAGMPTLYFAGDTNVFGDMALIRRIYAPDVAVLPIGDHFTMGPREAAVAAELVGAAARDPEPLRNVRAADRDARRAPRAAPRRHRARGAAAGRDDRAVIRRERWFGGTGRKVPELALVGTIDVTGALELDDVSGRRRAAGSPRRRHPRRRPCRARSRRSRPPWRGPRSRASSSPTRASSRSTSPTSRMAEPRTPIVATYSICACDLEAGQWGVATQSKFLAVGSVVPWAAPHVGAIATQAYANPGYGPAGLELLRGGRIGRRGRRAADRGRRRPRATPARSRRRRGARGDVHRVRSASTGPAGGRATATRRRGTSSSRPRRSTPWSTRSRPPPVGRSPSG